MPKPREQGRVKQKVAGIEAADRHANAAPQPLDTRPFTVMLPRSGNRDVP